MKIKKNSTHLVINSFYFIKEGFGTYRFDVILFEVDALMI